jgi:hypothetical protein
MGLAQALWVGKTRAVIRPQARGCPARAFFV